MQTGTDVFLEGLRGLGFAPTPVAGRPDHVVIDYEVENGKFAGTKLRLGFIVPPDFPSRRRAASMSRRLSILFEATVSIPREPFIAIMRCPFRRC